MVRYRTPTRKDWTIAAIAVGALTLVNVLNAVFGISRLGAPMAVLFAVAALLIVVRWHSATTAYRCNVCGNEFELSTLQDLFAPHMVTTKYVRCPVCNERTWAEALKKADPVRSPRYE